MKQVTEHAKRIAEAHLTAKVNNSFDDLEVSNMNEVLMYLAQGKTFSKLLQYVESKNTAIGSSLLSSVLQYNSNNYKQSIYVGFQNLLNKI